MYPTEQLSRLYRASKPPLREWMRDNSDATVTAMNVALLRMPSPALLKLGFESRWTDAPIDYDYGGTIRTGAVYKTPRFANKTFAQVLIEQGNLDHQDRRYGSGLHVGWTDVQLKQEQALDEKNEKRAPFMDLLRQLRTDFDQAKHLVPAFYDSDLGSYKVGHSHHELRAGTKFPTPDPTKAAHQIVRAKQRFAKLPADIKKEEWRLGSGLQDVLELAKREEKRTRAERAEREKADAKTKREKDAQDTTAQHERWVEKQAAQYSGAIPLALHLDSSASKVKKGGYLYVPGDEAWLRKVNDRGDTVGSHAFRVRKGDPLLKNAAPTVDKLYTWPKQWVEVPKGLRADFDLIKDAAGDPDRPYGAACVRWEGNQLIATNGNALHVLPTRFEAPFPIDIGVLTPPPCVAGPGVCATEGVVFAGGAFGSAFPDWQQVVPSEHSYVRAYEVSAKELAKWAARAYPTGYNDVTPIKVNNAGEFVMLPRNIPADYQGKISDLWTIAGQMNEVHRTHDAAAVVYFLPQAIRDALKPFIKRNEKITWSFMGNPLGPTLMKSKSQWALVMPARQ